MDKTIEKITSEFEEIKSVILKLKEVKKQENKFKRQLKTLKNKYTFLNEIIGIKIQSKELVNSIKKYFKELNLSIHDAPNNDKEGVEDLRLWVDGKLYIVEVTGSEKKIVTEKKSHQISKHINIRQKHYPNLKVIGLFIVNHDFETHFSKRAIKAFEKRPIEIALNNNYTLTTTLTLFNAFILIKQGSMTVSDLIEGFENKGLYEI